VKATRGLQDRGLSDATPAPIGGYKLIEKRLGALIAWQTSDAEHPVASCCLNLNSHLTAAALDLKITVRPGKMHRKTVSRSCGKSSA
jgi:hypothetical protein